MRLCSSGRRKLASERDRIPYKVHMLVVEVGDEATRGEEGERINNQHTVQAQRCF